MRVQLVAAGFLLTSAIMSVASAATVTMSPPSAELQPKTQPAVRAKAPPEPQHQVQAQPQAQPQSKAPADAQLKVQPQARPEVQAKAQPKTHPNVQARLNCPCNCPDRRGLRHQALLRPHRFVRRAVGSYAENGYYHYASAAPIRSEWHGHWRQHWREAPNDDYIARIPGPVEQKGLHVDDRGWTGGVGHAADGGFVDGYGQVHFASGMMNGPTYDSYNQSSQFNPSQPVPFQPRLMGGIATSRR